MTKKSVEDFAKTVFPQNSDKFEEAKKVFRDFYTSQLEELQAGEKAFRNLVSLLLKNQKFPEPKVSSRLKDRNECIRKFDRKYRNNLEEEGEDYEIAPFISDLIGVRVVCLYESDIEKVSDVLRSHFNFVDETNKTKELEGKGIEFGYKGLHLDLALNPIRKELPEYQNFSDWNFEVQIRTIVQDAWSEVDHKLKYKKKTPVILERRIIRLAALFELADQEFESIRDISDELEAKAKQPDKKLDEKSEPIDLFGFIRVASAFFTDYPFYGEALETLVSDILEAESSMTMATLRNALSSNITKVQEYRDYFSSIGNNMSPYTQVRHCLYLHNKVVFENMIFQGHRRNFDRWLEHGTVFPHEVDD